MKVARDSPEAETLVNEPLNFQVKITTAANDDDRREVETIRGLDRMLRQSMPMTTWTVDDLERKLLDAWEEDAQGGHAVADISRSDAGSRRSVGPGARGIRGR